MKKFLIPCMALTMQVTFAQHIEYKQVFAPTEHYVKKGEQPWRQDLCLNGNWQFQPVSLPANYKEGIDVTPALPPVANSWEKTPIRIPSPWNVNSFADKNGLGGDFRNYPSYPKEWENVKMGWLRRKFIVPANFKGKHLQLHFEALAGDAQIFVNGKHVGSHFGIFLPFDIDVTNAIIPGKENEVLIGVRKASLFDKQGEYGRRNYQAGSFWGQHIAGIWQDVYLVALAPVYITDVFVQPMVDADQLIVEVTVVNTTNKAANVDLNVTTGNLQFPAAKVQVPAHSRAVKKLTAAVQKQLKYWSPESPNLYNLVVKSSTGDCKYTRFGWRQLTFNKNKILLNGKELVMRGDSWHFMGIPQMSSRYARAWYQAMRDAGLNAVRLHAQPYPSFYLDVADEMGILVLDETAMWASDGGPRLDDPVYWQDSRRHLRELVLRDRNHPSVFGWSVSNEIMPIVRGVMRNPPGMKDTLLKNYHEWVKICRSLDPTRSWISADGEDDGEDAFPTYIVHYGGFDAMKRAEASGKPWGVGEAGNAYYGTPEQVSETNGGRAYESFLGRMEGVAVSSYLSLIGQQERNAVYQSVFNLVWYGLKPLPLGLKDTTKAPTLDDGIYFTNFKEGQPGVQPERLGPYSTTLNPGYDPKLPLYQTWPLFDAIRDAAHHTGKEKWKVKTTVVTQPTAAPVRSVNVLSGHNGKLAARLKRTGVLFSDKPDMLFIDGETPPDSKTIIDSTLANGGIVFVWGPTEASLQKLNSILPAPLTLTNHSSSSLLAAQSPITNGLQPADLYFSELRPPEIMSNGVLMEQSNVLIQACNTDWLRWNKQAEYAKTAMVLRSEREAKPSGAALIEKNIGGGKLFVTTLPASPRLARAERAIRTLLSNLGVPLGPGSDVGKPLLKGGDIVRALYAGSFPVQSVQDGLTRDFIDVNAGDSIKKSVKWQPFFEESGLVDISKLKLTGPRSNAVTYLSFWVSSPRDLSDLLIEPNIPVVNMEVSADDAAQVWLNGKMIIDTKKDAKAEALRLHQGWNHILIKVVQSGGGWNFSGRLTSSNHPEFIADLESALEKP